MAGIKATIKAAVTATIFGTCSASHLFAEQNTLVDLYDDLEISDAQTALDLEREIKRFWELSGSPSVDFIYEKGKNAFISGDYKSAIEHYSAVVEFAPEFATGWFARARAYTYINYDGPALEDLEMALSLDPRHFCAVLGLGQLLEKLDMPALAFKAYKEALEIHPHLFEAKELKERIEPSVLDKQI
jgi:tetratricopeptide (TPR) repeat protein